MSSFEIICRRCSDTLQVKEVQVADGLIRLLVEPCRCPKFEAFRTLDYIKGELHKMFRELGDGCCCALKNDATSKE